jgi:hypothetical protein
MQDQVLAWQAAFITRQRLIECQRAEQVRGHCLFNGSTANRPGLPVDRYRKVLLIQTFHKSPTLQVAVKETLISAR